MIGTVKINISAVRFKVLGIIRQMSESMCTDGRSNGCAALAQCDFRCSPEEHMLNAHRAVQDALEHGPKCGKVHYE